MKVIKNYLYNMGYQVLLLLAPLVTVPYVSRVLGAQGVGINDYTNAVVTFFLLFGQIGVLTYGNREIAYHRDNKYERSKIFWEIEFMQIATILLSFGIFLIFVWKFSQNYQWFFLVQSLLIIAGAFDISWYFMGMEDFQKTVTRNMIVKLGSIGLIFWIVKEPTDVWKYILILSASQLFGNITLWPYLVRNVQWIKLKKLRPLSHVNPALLLFIPTVTTQVYLVVNRIMLRFMDPTKAVAVGLFSQSDKIVKLVLAIVTATGTVMLPHIAHKFASGDVKGIRQSLYNSFDFVTALSVPMMFGVAAIAEKFAPWFLGTEFTPSGKIMMIEAPVIVLIAWSNVTGTQYLMPVNRVKEFTISVTIGAAVNIICNLFLIEVYGAKGAALSTTISEFTVTAFQIYCIKGTIKRRQLFMQTWKYALSGAVMFVVIYRLNAIMHMNITNLFIQIIIGALIYTIGLVLTKAPIVDQAQTLLNKRNNGK